MSFAFASSSPLYDINGVLAKLYFRKPEAVLFFVKKKADKKRRQKPNALKPAPA